MLQTGKNTTRSVYQATAGKIQLARCVAATQQRLKHLANGKYTDYRLIIELRAPNTLGGVNAFQWRKQYTSPAQRDAAYSQ